MQRAFLILTIEIVVCLQAQGCSSGSTGSSATAKMPDRWSSQGAYRHWSPDLFFDDPEVVQLCKAIAEKDYEQIDRLVKTEGVDVNATGRMNMTPLFWAFPLGYAEAFEKIPRDEDNNWVRGKIASTQQKYMGEHAQLMEHLLKLGASPNIRTTRGDVERLFKEGKAVIAPAYLFQRFEGLAVTHLASQPFGNSGDTLRIS